MFKQPIRNIAILAHVDAGKTTLSERILFTAAEIRHPGNVEDGLATMDYLPEEKTRGITIESGVAHFVWRDTWFNFIDTPGHIDFGAEVDSALLAAESAVLVVAASGGVESQTASAWQKLKEHRLKTFVFINKLDNPDYSLDDTLIGLEESFGVRPILLSFPEFQNGKLVSVIDVLSRTRLVHDAHGREIPEKILVGQEPEELLKYYAEAVEWASLADDSVLEAALAGQEIPPKQLLNALQKLSLSDVASERFVFCYAGSAKQNFSVRSLMTALSFFAPPPPAFNQQELGAVIRLRRFKNIVQDCSGNGNGQSFFKTREAVLFRAYANVTKENFPKDFSFYRLRANLLEPVLAIRAGDIYALLASKTFELGEVLDLCGNKVRCAIDFNGHYLPLLQTRLECECAEEFSETKKSIEALLRIDPSIRAEFCEESGDWVLHTVGEVQLEVFLDRLKREFDCKVHASIPEVLYKERLMQPIVKFRNKFQCGLSIVEVEFSAQHREAGDNVLVEVENADAHETTIVRETLENVALQGILGRGALGGVLFQVSLSEKKGEVSETMLQKVCEDAFKLSIRPENIRLFEPYMEVFVEAPTIYAGILTSDVYSRGGRIRSTSGDGNVHSFYAEIPLAKLFGYATAVRSGSRGTAIYSMRLAEYREVEKKS